MGDRSRLRLPATIEFLYPQADPTNALVAVPIDGFCALQPKMSTFCMCQALAIPRQSETIRRISGPDVAPQSMRSRV
jgi:hypothetical protein